MALLVKIFYLIQPIMVSMWWMGIKPSQFGSRSLSSDCKNYVLELIFHQNCANWHSEQSKYVSRHFFNFFSRNFFQHTQWYSTTVQNPDQDVSDAPFITRIFRDMRTRYEGFSRLNVWVADLLVAHCIMNNANTEDGGKLNPAKVCISISWIILNLK